MIYSLKPYSTYKDSSMPWLGKVPAHWEVRRGKMLFQPIDVRSRTGEEELLTVSSERGVVPRASANVTMFKAESYVGYKLCWPDDLVINSLWAWARGLGLSRYHGIVSSAYGVYRLLPKCKTSSQFIHNLVRSTPFQWELQVRSKGIWVSRLQLTDEAFLGAPFPLPSLPEQTAIVRFLDHADRRIRRYIRAKQKLIALLEEQKQAIIHQAVTGQIDVRTGQSYPAYKPSGVEWLGDVPAHWEIRTFTRSAVEIADYRGATPTKTESGVFLVTAKNIRSGWIDYEVSREFVAEDEYTEIMRRGFPRRGDLLLTTEAPLGHAALVDREEIALAQRVIRFRLAPQTLRTEFALHSVLDSYFQNQLLCRGTGSTALGIKASKLPQLKILCPPVDEQQTILVQITNASAPIDSNRALAIRQIDLLREYRTRLIADVVTGKLDVREAAATLPEVDPLVAEDTLGDALNPDVESALDELATVPEEAEA